MFRVITILLAFFLAFADCKKSVPRIKNLWTSILQEDDLALQPVSTHQSNAQYNTQDGSSPGWAYTYLYNGTVCENSKVAAAYGIVTNQCFTSYSPQNLSRTVMVTCDENFAYSILYNSTDCNPDTMLVNVTSPINTCFVINPYDVEDGVGIFGIDALQYSCVPGSTLPVPEGEWVLLSAYTKENCSDLYSFNAFLDDFCYQSEDDAFRFNYPNVTIWNSAVDDDNSYYGYNYDYYYPYYSSSTLNYTDCSNPNISTTIEVPITCVDEELSDDQFVYYYSDGVEGQSLIISLYSSTGDPTTQPTAIPTTDPTVHPSAVPTMDPTTQPTTIPTADPTVQPTAVPTRVPTTQGTLAPTLVPTSSPTFPAYLIFTSNITLSGVSSTSLDQASQQAVVNTTAISMNIPNNQVSFVSAYSVPSSSPVSVSVSASAVRGHTRGGKVHSTASSSIVAITKVKAPLSDPSQSTALYTQLTSALNQSVSSNEFSETLQSLSKATGATQTMNANATGVWSSAATVSSVATSSSSSSNDNGLSGGAIAGIVIGVVAFMALMLGGGYYLYAKKNSQSSGSSNNVTNEAPAVDIVMMDNPAARKTEFAGVNPMQRTSLPPQVVAVVIEEGVSESQVIKESK